MSASAKKITEKHKKFLIFIAKGLSQGEAYLEAFDKKIPLLKAHQRGYQIKKFLENSEDYREILKMFNPPSELSMGISELRKHPNPDIQLRAIMHATKCLGWFEEAQNVNLGFQVIIGGRQPGAIPQGEEPVKIEAPKKPVSLIK